MNKKVLKQPSVIPKKTEVITVNFEDIEEYPHFCRSSGEGTFSLQLTIEEAADFNRVYSEYTEWRLKIFKMLKDKKEK